MCLPLFETNVNLTEDEKVIYKLLSKTIVQNQLSEIAPYVPFGKSKTTHLLKPWEKRVWLQLKEKAEEQNI